MRNVDKAVVELIKDLKEKGVINDKQYAEVLGEFQSIREIAQFKRDCKIRSMEIARDMRPSTHYSSGQGIIPASYDLINEANKIYEWLTKDINP